MSYVIKVVKRNGELFVISDAPQYVPEGSWTVNGHMADPGGTHSLYVGQCDAEGRPIMSASVGVAAPAEQPAPAAQEATV